MSTENNAPIKEDVITTQATEENKVTFADLGLSSKVLTAIEKRGYKFPSPVQELAIPEVLKDENDFIVQAKTGTGKTAAFGLPIINQIKAGSGNIKAMILTPTRELAVQVSAELSSFSRDLKVVTVYGGQPIRDQKRSLAKGCDIVVGTPGRVIDFLSKDSLRIDNLDFLVLDEADEMLNMGFIEDVETILSYTPTEKRMLMFSATMPPRLASIAERFMKNVKSIKVQSKEMTTNLVDQRAYIVKDRDRFEALDRLICMEKEFYGIIFTQTKIDAERVSAKLDEKGYAVEFLHGDIPQKSREELLKSFKQQKIRILVATDVAARGIDVNNLTHVVNFSVPESPEAYVHRIGRTGRAGKSGNAITLVVPSEKNRLERVRKRTKAAIPLCPIPAAQEVVNAKKEYFKKEIIDILEEEPCLGIKSFSEDLLAHHSPSQLITALLHMNFGSDLNEKNYPALQQPKDAPVSLYVSRGRIDKMNSRQIISFLAQKSGVNPSQIDGLKIFERFSTCSAPKATADKILRAFKRGQGRPAVRLDRK